MNLAPEYWWKISLRLKLRQSSGDAFQAFFPKSWKSFMGTILSVCVHLVRKAIKVATGIYCLVDRFSSVMGRSTATRAKLVI